VTKAVFSVSTRRHSKLAPHSCLYGKKHEEEAESEKKYLPEKQTDSVGFDLWAAEDDPQMLLRPQAAELRGPQQQVRERTREEARNLRRPDYGRCPVEEHDGNKAVDDSKSRAFIGASVVAKSKASRPV
ncbi:hypothetical protein B296_00024056, partial [Ensete ventricosum]